MLYFSCDCVLSVLKILTIQKLCKKKMNKQKIVIKLCEAFIILIA